jgi:ParB-like chromosome segregation protein Spo0J
MRPRIRQVALDRLVPHPDNPNRMSRSNFRKLLGHLERTGRYEPLVVRPCPGRRGFFQIINGQHRCEALRRLGHRKADVVVWDIDDDQTDLLLATLNRLGGRDTLDRKLALLRRLSAKIPTRKLARMLPQTQGQIERLIQSGPPAQTLRRRAEVFAIPVVFFVDAAQQQRIEAGLARAEVQSAGTAQTRAAKRAAALLHLIEFFLERAPRDASAGPPR